MKNARVYSEIPNGNDQFDAGNKRMHTATQWIEKVPCEGKAWVECDFAE